MRNRLTVSVVALCLHYNHHVDMQSVENVISSAI